MDTLMDINIWRSIITVLSLVTFLCLMGWTYSRKNSQAFDEAAALPFKDDVVNSTQSGVTHE
jgi:cytochrome c oxidase cbb3-type subunit 4